MDKFIGTKEVSAEPMQMGGKDGYKVKYSDGYESWSPKEAFEACYRETCAMTFGQALELMKRGCKVARNGWNGKGQYIELANHISYINADGDVVNADHDAIGSKAIAFVGTSGVQLGWLASQADMLAEDWCVVG